MYDLIVLSILAVPLALGFVSRSYGMALLLGGGYALVATLSISVISGTLFPVEGSTSGMIAAFGQSPGQQAMSWLLRTAWRTLLGAALAAGAHFIRRRLKRDTPAQV